MHHQSLPSYIERLIFWMDSAKRKLWYSFMTPSIKISSSYWVRFCTTKRTLFSSSQRSRLSCVCCIYCFKQLNRQSFVTNACIYRDLNFLFRQSSNTFEKEKTKSYLTLHHLILDLRKTSVVIRCVDESSNQVSSLSRSPSAWRWSLQFSNVELYKNLNGWPPEWVTSTREDWTQLYLSMSV